MRSPPRLGERCGTLFHLLIPFQGGARAYGSSMRRFAPWTLALVTVLVIAVPFALAATSTPAPTPDRSPGNPVASVISTVTGIAISPLLGTGAYGAYQWMTAKNEAARAALPWFAQISFWLPALLIVGVCALKDTLGAIVPPGLKKPLDVLETMENKLSGLVAAGAVVPISIATVTRMVLGDGKVAAAGADLAGSGLAVLPLGAADLSGLLSLLTVPLGVAVFLIVWLGSHAINVLILLSPWGAIDAGLKAARTALLGLVTVTATINPWVGALLSVVVIIVAYLVAGWAFRLTVFGSVFCWDFLTGRRKSFSPAEGANPMFAGPALPGVPVRTYGSLERGAAGGLEFKYRPWLVLPERTTALATEARGLAVGEGAFFSDILSAEGRSLFSLPPRYRGHEAKVAAVYGLGGGVKPAGLRKAWAALREILGTTSKQTA